MGHILLAADTLRMATFASSLGPAQESPPALWVDRRSLSWSASRFCLVAGFLRLVSGCVPTESSKLGQGTGACACLPAAALAALGLTWGRKESVVIGYPATFQWSDWKANIPLWLHRGLCVC